MNLSKAIVAALFFAFFLRGTLAYGQLSPTFYIRQGVTKMTLVSDPRIAAPFVRLHFHACFFNGCDGSVLLDDTDTQSEKEANANNYSARGFDAVDRMEALLEPSCPATVSCADIVTIASERSVFLSGGLKWTVPSGKRDSTTACRAAANAFIPAPFDTLRERFTNVSLSNNTDLVSLPPASTFGRVSTFFFLIKLIKLNTSKLHDKKASTIDIDMLQIICGEEKILLLITDLDPTTPDTCDSNYFSNLQVERGQLQSDQELFSTPGADDVIALVNAFSANQTSFFESFVESMIRTGNLSPLTGTEGEIRLNCSVVNANLAGLDSLLVSSI
uniref:Peroxidase n=1 Tax=Populus trichocarpa TaxID=3694 RepID=W8QPM9_POPTR|nr:class III peroxidase [Populus trichocarpa]